MQIDWWTLALQAINALVLIWLLQRFLFRPVAGIIEARQDAAARMLTEAEAARKSAEAERARARAEAEDQAAGRAEALKAAEAEAQSQRAALVAAARSEAERLTAAAKAEIERNREAEAAKAADQAARLAVDIAARLFRRLPPEAQIAGFIDGLAESLATLPDDARAEIAPKDGALRLRAPRTLTPEEEDACRTALSEALGREVEIAVEVDPEVIAGLEADGALGSVRNSFRADLERMTESLTRHDETLA
jgi:F-type H+-transporting ATPase subunit b